MSDFPITKRSLVTLQPYFEINEGKIDEFKNLVREYLPLVQKEEKCVIYEYSFRENIAYVREAYEDTDGVLHHMQNVSEFIGKLLEISKLNQFEAHGPADQVIKFLIFSYFFNEFFISNY